MANIGMVLKGEISRLSRKEARKEVGVLKKASGQYRRHIAALKREVSSLRKQLARLSSTIKANGHAPADEAEARPMRFVAKGLKSHRQRIGFSAPDYARLLGVSSQTVYNWEQGVSRPRPAQLPSIAALREVGKREAHTRLEHLDGKASGKRKSTNA